MSESQIDLPVPIVEFPHWRVNIRPSVYSPESIPNLKRCVDFIQHNAVRFRGWDYPMWAAEVDCASYGDNWIASWSQFMGHNEYWRLYQSGQFIHLFGVREFIEKAWDNKLRATLIQQQDVDKIPGFLSEINTIYTIAEITEFATRMAQSDVLVPSLSISISLSGIQGFVLTRDGDRGLFRKRFTATQERIANVWQFTSEQIIADSVTPAVQICQWIFERFGWLNTSPDPIEKDIVQFKKGLV